MTAQRALPRPPEYPDLSWRHLYKIDAPAMHRIATALGSTNGISGVDAVTDYAAEFDNPDTDPVVDTIAAADVDGTLVGFGWAMVDGDMKDETRIDFWIDVHPNYKQRKLDDFLLIWLRERARQIRTRFPADHPCWANMPAEWSRTERVTRYEAFGMRARHSEQHMRLDLSAPAKATALPQGTALLPWSTERDELMRETFNRAFADRPGAREIRPESWQHFYSGTSAFCGDLSFIALDGDQGVGIIRSLIDEELSQGEIAHVAVRKEWRGRGIGTALCRAALDGFKARHLATAHLSVDVKNTPAITCYERLGFTTYNGYTSYRLDL